MSQAKLSNKSLSVMWEGFIDQTCRRGQSQLWGSTYISFMHATVLNKNQGYIRKEDSDDGFQADKQAVRSH